MKWLEFRQRIYMWVILICLIFWFHLFIRFWTTYHFCFQKRLHLPVTEHGKYRIHFPEEQIYLNLTRKLANEVNDAVEKAGGGGSNNKSSTIVDYNYIHPRSITERLLRRIVAKLLRVSVQFYYLLQYNTWLIQSEVCTLLIICSPILLSFVNNSREY